ncbi:MAG: DUF192 domain-containing protein [Candidatus Micrarchaeia archaeon]
MVCIHVKGRKFIVSPLLFVFLPFLYFCGPYNKRRRFRFGRATVHAYIADNFFSRAIGYMFRDPKDIPDDEGILFVYDKPVQASFWMLDVHFPIDLYVLDDRFRPVAKTRLEKHSTKIQRQMGRLFLEVKSQ